MTPTPAPAPVPHGSTLDTILHALILTSITAASIFVKNPKSQDHAASIINVVNSNLLPLADALLTEKK